jgi:cytochrome c peroxidase
MTLLLALQLTIPAGLDAFIPTPDDNPITRENAELGKKLFFDKSLSRDKTVSCGTCHIPERAFSDDKPLAIGLENRRGKRRTPTIINRGYGKSFFWDGRSPTLEDQVLKPIQNPDEMDLTLAEASQRVSLDPVVISKALATYVRTILAGDSPYDRYLRGDKSALAPEQLAGLRLFRGKANCTSCHLGPNLTDERLHNTGLGEFKTPTLREAARRPPYMHDGSLATLEDVIEHYDKGGKPDPRLDPEIRKLNLSSEDKRALIAFLRSLSGVVKDGYR